MSTCNPESGQSGQDVVYVDHSTSVVGALFQSSAVPTSIVPGAQVKYIMPLLTIEEPRIAGFHLGAAWTSEDFDEPLPDNFWTGNE